MSAHLEISFTDQSESFVHGVEAGMYYQMMSTGVACISRDQPVHVANKEVISAMAKTSGYACTWSPYDATYAFVTLVKLTYSSN